MFELFNKAFNIFQSVKVIKMIFSAVKTQSANTLFLNLSYVFVILSGLFIACWNKIMPYISKLFFSFTAAAKSLLSKRRVQKITEIDYLDKTIAVAGYAYDYKQDIFYSKIDAWQRQMGYCRLYDEAALPMGMVIDSEPIFFEYNDKKWLIEFWKGQYDLTCGGEIGVYTSNKRDVEIMGVFEGTFYDCVSNADMLHMKFVLRKNGKVLFERKGRQWWLTGFRLGAFSHPDDLSMDIEITLKDEKMLRAFVCGLKSTGYKDEEIEINKNTVSIMFNKPNTKQPFTRKEKTEKAILDSSKALCSAYQDITSHYDTMPEKIMAIRYASPEIYKHILNIGKNEQIFFKSDIIRNYIRGEQRPDSMTEITNAYNGAKRISYDSTSKFVIMSDVHRGTRKKSDDFLKNEKLYFSALKKYYKNDYTYIELGDGEELWENRSIANIIDAYLDVYLLLKKFHAKNRLYLVYGNHDMEKQSKKYIENNLYKYYDSKSGKYKTLFNNLKTYEAIVLEHKVFEKDIFLLHGHQADFFNNKLWYLARFLLRVLWKPLEYLDIQDPTRTAKVYRKKLAVERKLTKWAIENKHMIIAGHTHKPMFSDFDVPPYFNDGSCVSSGGITAIEIENGSISLVKWSYKTKTDEIAKDVLAGPMGIEKYFQKTNRKKTTA